MQESGAGPDTTSSACDRLALSRVSDGRPEVGVGMRRRALVWDEEDKPVRSEARTCRLVDFSKESQ